VKVIPSVIWNSNRRSDKGEPQVKGLLEDINIGSSGVAMHSQNIHGGKKQAWHELDFLVISNRAIIGIEVKAGKVICRDGIWQVLKHDQRTVAYEKRKSPLVQASDALEHLRNVFFKKTYKYKYSQLPFVKIAVLCSNTRPDQDMGLEMVDELTIYEEDLSPAVFKKRLNIAIQYHITEGHVGTAMELSDEEVDSISNAIRPDLDLSYPSSSHMEHLRASQDTLTDEQLKFTDLIDAFPRYIVDGGAGTGKTFLLTYDAMRQSAKGKRVGILTPNTKLAEHIAKSCGKNVVCFSENNLSEKSPFDVLYVDECQDFINEKGMSLIEFSVSGGLADGVWRLFGDFENQLSSNKRNDPDVWELLLECASNNVPIKLSRNVRNTPEILKWLEISCSARIGKTDVKGHGPEVQIISSDDFSMYLSGDKEHPLYGWIDQKEAVTLYPESIDHAAIKTIVSRVKNTYLVSSIEEFKGLEANVVFVCGTEQVTDSGILRDQLYKGVSRARNLCLIVGPKELIGIISNLRRDFHGE
jgi:hypothetical protein